MTSLSYLCGKPTLVDRLVQLSLNLAVTDARHAGNDQTARQLIGVPTFLPMVHSKSVSWRAYVGRENADELPRRHVVSGASGIGDC